MPVPLFVKWNKDDECNYPILDEQHWGLVATINSLHYFIQKGWAIKDLKPTLVILREYVIFHLKTEQMILVRNNIPKDILSEVLKYHKDFISNLEEETHDAIEHDDPEQLLSYLTRWWQGHKKNFHAKLAQYTA